MKKILNIWRFERLSDTLEGRNLYKGYLLIPTPNGNVKVTIDHRHLSFWMDEFDVSESEIELRLINHKNHA